MNREQAINVLFSVVEMKTNKNYQKMDSELSLSDNMLEMIDDAKDYVSSRRRNKRTNRLLI